MTNRKQLETPVKAQCLIMSMMLTPAVLKVTHLVAHEFDMTSEEDVQAIATEITVNMFAGMMYGAVCVANGILEATGEPLEGKGDITMRVTEKILNNTFKLMNDELNDNTPRPSHN